MTTTNQTPTPLPTVVVEYLRMERANLIQRLTFVEQQLGMPSSIVPKSERRQAAKQQKTNT